MILLKKFLEVLRTAESPISLLGGWRRRARVGIIAGGNQILDLLSSGLGLLVPPPRVGLGGYGSSGRRRHSGRCLIGSATNRSCSTTAARDRQAEGTNRGSSFCGVQAWGMRTRRERGRKDAAGGFSCRRDAACFACGVRLGPVTAARPKRH